jgi:hypothetical protein
MSESEETQARHTSGPWVVKEEITSSAFRHGVYAAHPDGEGEWICDVDCTMYPGRDWQAVHADALLIAAAPELLEALQGVLRVADRKTVEFDAARAVIAKATGGRQ